MEKCALAEGRSIKQKEKPIRFLASFFLLQDQPVSVVCLLHLRRKAVLQKQNGPVVGSTSTSKKFFSNLFHCSIAKQNRIAIQYYDIEIQKVLETWRHYMDCLSNK
jgi:hypothetical protein